MRTFRQSMLIVSLFALLFAVVFVPMLFIEYQNDNMLREFYVSSANVPMLDVLDASNSKSENYNIWEHLVILKKSVVVKATVPTEAKAELLERMEKQLAEICRYNAIPLISPTGVIQSSVIKETYMDRPSSGSYTDILDSDQVLSVWEIIVEYQDYVVCAYMDTETDAIYEITIVTKESDFLYQPEITDTGFLEYLRSFSDTPPELGMNFSAWSYYAAGKINLSLCSVEGNSELTMYQFDNTMRNDSYPMYIMITESDAGASISAEDANMIQP